MDYAVKPLERHTDRRGSLDIFLRASELRRENKKFGQIYLITFAKKGTVRGNHYHKKRNEWFGILSGTVSIVIEDVNTKERVKVVLSAKKDADKKLQIGPHNAHAIKSLTKSAVLLSCADDEWTPADTFPYELL